MLKLIYTETAPYLELLTAHLEDWIEQRLSFAVATGEQLLVSAEQASFLLPDLVCDIKAVNLYLQRAGVTTVTVQRCDLDRSEIGLTGYWLATHTDCAEGIFVTQLPERVESYLWQLWRHANSPSIASNGTMGW
ncbi:alr0857 family protein [Chamaesiphon sp. OTE_75_metabat_556]|jgi:hypothetical protein|uniref:alr0857 family protein n=1 Tax=Chamaesiphon sp. OTE_75_metabat_556 TaxID=2964692 RepID=UPI00286CA7F6|nr:alr0857 family protein [Chamaesiphon sp. OTE_75_metabat_556]